ncbi:MAG TPA: hypothetical protein VK025_13345 [Steroidobacter sp.]|nr:hypothetical protein [Steroidobacteraceae bacterium]HLS82382.1 hypothetical protein [Steroidobacter sp.]
MSVDLADKVQALRSSDAYAERPREVQAIETHFAWVFLTERFAYKLKKPVRTAFVDLRSLGARRANCLEELRLNRRLAEHVYLDVVPLVQHADGTLRPEGEGETIDWLVKMVRLPSDRMLDRAIAAQRAAPAALDAVGRRLAEFHAVQARIDFDPRGYVERMVRQIDEDRVALLAPELGLPPDLVGSAAQLQMTALENLEAMVQARARERRIVEAHGDLRPEHICLIDPPCVIDTLEFSLDLRTLDPAEELAFLRVECEQAGADWVGERIFDAWRLASGDPIAAPLVDFYRSRRAVVRGKLVAWHLLDPAVSAARPWAEQTQRYLEVACTYARLAAGGA